MRDLIEAAKSLYEQDEYAWALEQAAHLESGEVEKLDRKNLAQYLLEMTRSDERKLESRMAVLLAHMLKVVAQPEKHTRSWNKSILVQQRELRILLRKSPSLQAKVSEAWEFAFGEARRQAASETGLPLTTFPSANRWTFEEALEYEPPAPLSPMDRWRKK